MLRRLNEDPEPLTQHFPDVRPELEAVILRSLARDRDDRFADADEMRLALIEIAGRDWNEQRYDLKAEAPAQKKLEVGAAPPVGGRFGQAHRFDAHRRGLTERRSRADRGGRIECCSAACGRVRRPDGLS